MRHFLYFMTIFFAMVVVAYLSLSFFVLLIVVAVSPIILSDDVNAAMIRKFLKLPKTDTYGG